MDAHTLGKYRLLRCIGAGGMAEVYEARRADDPTTDERVAVKVLLPQHVHEMDIVRSFIDEATIAASLSHPNVVGVLDYGCADDQYFIVLEHVDGWDLQQLIGLCTTLERPLPVPAAAYVICELARALDYIHTRPLEIVHRDVTPHNVFVDRAGRVKLSDFGVAKTAARWSQTHTGLIKGKLSYLAPEQVRGEPVSQRTDIYSTGLVLFELLTCRRYNRSSTQSGLLTRAHDPEVVPPSRHNPDAAPLDEVVRGALQHDPVMRTRDAALLVEQTRDVLLRHPFGAAELAELVAQLRRDASAVVSEEATIPEGLRELVVDETEQTLRTGAPHGLGGGRARRVRLEPEVALGAPSQEELLLEETLRTGAPEQVQQLAAAGAPPLRATRTEESYLSGPATLPGPPTGEPEASDEPASDAPEAPAELESGLIRLLRAPEDWPLQATATGADDLALPRPRRRGRWGWLLAGVLVLLAAGGLLLLRWVQGGWLWDG